nr:MAG TPA: Putative virion structural protein [Caudoviricetes sp.]
MSMLSLALNEVHQTIPEELLDATFLEPFRTNFYNPVNVDALITSEVVQARVLPDLNVEYAQKIKVPLAQCKVQQISPQEYVVTVPPEATGNRKIISVMGLNYNVSVAGSAYYEMAGDSGSALMNVAQKMANSNMGVVGHYDTKVDMISGNSFRVRRSPMLNSTVAVELIIENDPKLNNIPIMTANYIKKLIVLATKAYIYRKMVFKVNKARIEGGAEISVFSEFIDRYADAEEQYQEELMHASRIQWQSDEEMKTDLWRMTISGLI